ncbi:hypothetical protein I6A60_26920 [Frankia sp. AgB1.9]|uniref:cell division protein PerM n=1 Tax=unclassified Frankia TaxID=2632575 RepID=UPI001934A9B7|nr:MULTISPECIES: DUF6350 family protein [unclassified Frankia]MBL7490091.1 hypothetical protein [Frankia sp. AgW1.1]MBL7551461.1 hypothetical protein [Frankia sp. AgB1.9]
MAHPVASRGSAVVRRSRAARLAYAFGVSLPGPVAAGAAGLVAVELLVLMAWGADTRAQAGAGSALRVGADLWLLAHGASLRLPAGAVHFHPLGLVVMPLLVAGSAGYRLAAARAEQHSLLQRAMAGRRRLPIRPGATLASGTVRPAAAKAAASAPSRVSRRAAALDVVAVVVAQTALVLAVCLAASAPAARPAVGSAVAGAIVLSGLGATAGVLAGHRRVRSAWRLVPAVLRVPLAAGCAGTAALAAVGALGLCVLLIARAGSVAAAANGLGPGVVGGFGLFAGQLAVLPNLVVWGVCYALGIGFAAGPELTLTPTSAAPGSLPDLPVLRLLPTAPLPGWAWLVLAVAPLAAGVALALTVRRGSPGGAFGGRLSMVCAGTVVCALLVGLLAAVSGGGIGAGVAARLGPAPGWAMLATFVEVGMAGALVTSVAELVRRR